MVASQIPNGKKTPKLRFNSFSAQWEVRHLNDLFIKKTKKNTDSAEKFVLTNSATEGIVGQLDYFDKDIANQDNIEGYYIVEVDDFVYNPRISKYAPVGPLKRNNYRKGIMSPLYTVLQPKVKILDYLEHYFSTQKWYRYMYQIANYGARHDRMNIGQSDFLNLPIPYPEQAEQQKIAEFLNAIDNWIKNLKQQKNKLESYKKGMMQKIFSQEIRFKDEDGQEFPKWINTTLNEVVAIFLKGKGIAKDDIAKDGLNECIRYGELYTDYLEIIEKIISRTNTKAEDSVLSKENDLLIPSSGEDSIEIAKVSCITKSGVLLGGDLNIIRLKKGNSGIFFAYYLSNEKKIQIAKMAQGNSVVHLYNSSLKSLDIFIPDYLEQKKIADYLTVIDASISSKQQKIKKAELWKRGLLQQLFV